MLRTQLQSEARSPHSLQSKASWLCYSLTRPLFLNSTPKSWLGGLAGWSSVRYTQRLQVQSLVRAHTRGDQLMFLSLSHTLMFLSPTLSLPHAQLTLALKSINKYLCEGFKKETENITLNYSSFFTLQSTIMPP